MRATLIAISILLTSSVVLATTVRLSNGRAIEATIVSEEEGRVLLQTKSGDATGLAWVDGNLVAGKGSSGGVDVDAEVTRAQKLMAERKFDEARLLLEPLIPQFPANNQLKRVLIDAERRCWRFSPALTLIKDLAAREREAGKVSAETARLFGEICVLANDERRLREASRDIRRAVYENREESRRMREFTDSLKDQLEGGERIVWPSDVPPQYDTELQAEKRKTFDKELGHNHFSAEVAKEIRDFLNAENGRTVDKPDDFVRAIDVKPISVQAYEAKYAAGAPLKRYRHFVSDVRVRIKVDSATWLEMFDWQKHVELYGVVYKAHASFPNADVYVYVYNENAELASAKRPYNGQISIGKTTEGNFDRVRYNNLVREYEDFRENRNR